MKQESFKFFENKENPKLVQKHEAMREVNFKAVACEATENWRKHIPVFGWIQMNYPSSLQLPLSQKYKVSQNSSGQVTSERDTAIDTNIKKNSKTNVTRKDDRHRSPYRLDPEYVNEDVMKELDSLVPVDHTKLFLKNYPQNSLGFIKNNFRQYEQNKNGILVDPNIPHNYTNLIINGSNLFLYQLGYKNAFSFLTTTDDKIKRESINLGLMFDKKYCTMTPKSCMLGPEKANNFAKKVKKIGDISFEEVKNEIESVKNLSRLPPENITEEWIKDNLNGSVQGLNVENCYWLSKDLLSKIGRLDDKLEELSLRNLEISNFIVENILTYATSLKVLDLSNCTGIEVGICPIIAEHSTKLSRVNLFGLKQPVTDSGLEIMSKMENLSELNIGHCSGVSDSGLNSFAENRANKMTSLDFTACYKLTTEGLKSILNKNSLSLRTLNISLLPLVNSDICSEVSKCKNLISLDMSGCILINSDSLLNLFCGALQNLEVLNLSGLPLLTDNVAINSMVANRAMRILRLSNCPLLTVAILEHLMNSPNDLLLLEINRTPLIPDIKILETIKKRAPNLRIIRATNIKWPAKNLGLKIPLMNDHFVMPTLKGAKKPQKKNEDKNPENQLKKLKEEMRPRMIYEFPEKVIVKRVAVKKR